MKTRLNSLCILMGVLLLCFFNGGCTGNDPYTVIDESTSIEGQHWAYIDQVKYNVKVDNEKQAYNIYLNLRVTSAYKYSNLFVFVHQTGPDKKRITERHEVTLANKDGEWRGTGAGNFFSYQVLMKRKYHFAKKGNYTIAIEQNMRDNPLAEVSDVGLRVEKAQ